MDDSKLLVSASPHLRAPDSIEKVMWNVVVALAPAVAFSVYFFGLQAVQVYLLSIAAAEASELACLRARGKPLAWALDGSAFVTGVLSAMIIPASVAWYVPVVGSAFAVAIAKHAFGGLGNNIWNPALAGRVFLQFAYPQQISLSQWPVPRMLWGAGPDAVSMPSPLAEAATETAGWEPGYLDLLFGNGVAGSLGETCKIALIIGGVYLILRNIIDWRVPLFYLGTVFILAFVLPVREGAPAWSQDGLYHVLSGGLIIGAVYMATDMVTTPVTALGRSVFAVGCGFMVTLIRRYGGYPEGVAYSILFMNTFAPLIDRWVRPRVYGSKTPKPAPRHA